jgi:hypothetical protein
MPAGGALATGTLDRSQTDHSITIPNWHITNLELMQPFTAHLTGTLDSVDIYGQGSSILFEIQGGGIVATQYVNLSSSGWSHVVVKNPPNVVAGTTYEIILATSGAITWDGSCSVSVSGGAAAVLDPAVSPKNWISIPQYGIDTSTLGYCTTAFAFRDYVTTAPKPTATPAPKAKATPTPTALPAATPTLSPTAASSSSAGVPDASAIAAAAPTASPSDSSTPAAAAASDAPTTPAPGDSSSSGPPIAIIIGGGLLVAVALGAGAWLLLRRRAA